VVSILSEVASITCGDLGMLVGRSLRKLFKLLSLVNNKCVIHLHSMLLVFLLSGENQNGGVRTVEMAVSV
jgi:hypothetical protein